MYFCAAHVCSCLHLTFEKKRNGYCLPEHTTVDPKFGRATSFGGCGWGHGHLFSHFLIILMLYIFSLQASVKGKRKAVRLRRQPGRATFHHLELFMWQDFSRSLLNDFVLPSTHTLLLLRVTAECHKLDFCVDALQASANGKRKAARLLRQRERAKGHRPQKCRKHWRAPYHRERKIVTLRDPPVARVFFNTNLPGDRLYTTVLTSS